jgi:hypothetical protein
MASLKFYFEAQASRLKIDNQVRQRIRFLVCPLRSSD